MRGCVTGVTVGDRRMLRGENGEVQPVKVVTMDVTMVVGRVVH